MTEQTRTDRAAAATALADDLDRLDATSAAMRAADLAAERERLGDATAHTGRGAAAASDAVESAQEVIRAAASVAHRDAGLARRSTTLAEDIAQEVSARMFADLASGGRPWSGAAIGALARRIADRVKRASLTESTSATADLGESLAAADDNTADASGRQRAAVFGRKAMRAAVKRADVMAVSTAARWAMRPTDDAAEHATRTARIAAAMDRPYVPRRPSDAAAWSAAMAEPSTLPAASVGPVTGDAEPADIGAAETAATFGITSVWRPSRFTTARRFTVGAAPRSDRPTLRAMRAYVRAAVSQRDAVTRWANRHAGAFAPWAQLAAAWSADVAAVSAETYRAAVGRSGRVMVDHGRDVAVGSVAAAVNPADVIGRGYRPEILTERRGAEYADGADPIAHHRGRMVAADREVTLMVGGRKILVRLAAVKRDRPPAAILARGGHRKVSATELLSPSADDATRTALRQGLRGWAADVMGAVAAADAADAAAIVARHRGALALRRDARVAPFGPYRWARPTPRPLAIVRGPYPRFDAADAAWSAVAAVGGRGIGQWWDTLGLVGIDAYLWSADWAAVLAEWVTGDRAADRARMARYSAAALAEGTARELLAAGGRPTSLAAVPAFGRFNVYRDAVRAIRGMVAAAR